MHASYRLNRDIRTAGKGRYIGDGHGVLIRAPLRFAEAPNECCRPNAAIDVSRPVGTRGGVGWMRGPCACPRPGEMIQRLSMKPWRTRHSQGQAQGPHPSPHPPLVPTERRGRKRPDGRDYPLRLEKFIRGEGGGVGKGKKDTGYLYKALMVARRLPRNLAKTILTHTFCIRWTKILVRTT